MKKLDKSSIDILNLLRRNASKIPLWEAYDLVEEYQNMRNALSARDFIIMTLLEDIGVDRNGNLKYTDELKNKSDEFWTAIEMSLGEVHVGYACSPFIDPEWKKNTVKEYKINNKGKVENYKKSILDKNKSNDLDN